MTFKDFILPILALPRLAKICVVASVDTTLCIFSLWLALYLRLGEFVALSGILLFVTLISISLAISIFIVSGLYKVIFRHSGWSALAAVTRSVVVYGLFFSSIVTVIGLETVPRTVGIIQPILLLLFVGASRAFARTWLGDRYQDIIRLASRPKALVYGAGSAGRQLVSAIRNSPEMQIVGFLDDDDRLHGQILNGYPIYSPKDLSGLVMSRQISDVLLAMPRLGRNRRNEIIASISKVQVAVRTLPSLTDLARGKVSIADVRDLDIDDILGREPVVPNQLLLSINIRDKVVMVTGAGGSIGAELCRQILRLGPKRLLLVDKSEFALYTIHQQLDEINSNGQIDLIPLLASVQDESRMSEIIGTLRPQTIYHAAAYKHVPMVEHNAAEGIKNNVFGTLNLARAARDNHVPNFVLISTDKAVRPTNIMGASKRLAEMVLQALAMESTSTKFCIVRFGNVLGSSGSVVPKFRNQVRDGGPVTVTHPDITRYFMTIPEAAQLVIQAGAMARGGDVFVLDMGPPVKILDLAKRIVELSGLSVKNSEAPTGDVEIKITGLRPGEKLFEELLIGDDPQSTIHPRIMRSKDEFIKWGQLNSRLLSLKSASSRNDVSLIRAILQELVVGYAPSDKIVDWIYAMHGQVE